MYFVLLPTSFFFHWHLSGWIFIVSIFFIRPEMKLGGALPLFPVSLPLTLSALFSSSLSFQCDLLLTTNYQKKKNETYFGISGRIARNAWKTVGINDASFLSLAKHAARGGEGRLVVIFFYYALVVAAVLVTRSLEIPSSVCRQDYWATDLNLRQIFICPLARLSLDIIEPLHSSRTRLENLHLVFVVHCTQLK